MKLKSASLLMTSLLALAGLCAAIPASADTVLYDNTTSTSLGNGDPTSGLYAGAWAISNDGVGDDYMMSNSFTLAQGSTVSDATLAVWLFGGDGDELTSLDWSISTEPLGAGTILASGNDVDPLSQSNVGSYGGYFPINDATISLDNTDLAVPGTYYLNISEATDSDDAGVYWDESDGASTSYQADNGSLLSPTTGSETFQILGNVGTVPEPTSLLLFGTGMLGLALFMRRRPGLVN